MATKEQDSQQSTLPLNSSEKYAVTPLAIATAESALYENFSVEPEPQRVTGEKHFTVDLTIPGELTDFYENNPNPESTDTPRHQVEEGMGLALGTAIGYILSFEDSDAYDKISADDIREEISEGTFLDDESFEDGFENFSKVLENVVPGWGMTAKIRYLDNPKDTLAALAIEADPDEIETLGEKISESSKDAYKYTDHGNSELENWSSRNTGYGGFNESRILWQLRKRGFLGGREVHLQNALNAYELAQEELENARESFENLRHEVDTDRPLLQEPLGTIDSILEEAETTVDEKLEEIS